MSCPLTTRNQLQRQMHNIMAHCVHIGYFNNYLRCTPHNSVFLCVGLKLVLQPQPHVTGNSSSHITMNKMVWKTFWFCLGDKRGYVGGHIGYGVMTNPLVPNFWPMKMGSDLTTIEASILEDSWLKLVCSRDSHVV